MTRDEMISIIGRPILRPIGLIQAVFLLAIIISPFCWIWHSWGIAWKIGLTGLLGSMIMKVVHTIVVKVITTAVDQELKNVHPDKPVSEFHKRLEKLYRETRKNQTND